MRSCRQVMIASWRSESCHRQVLGAAAGGEPRGRRRLHLLRPRFEFRLAARVRQGSHSALQPSGRGRHTRARGRHTQRATASQTACTPAGGQGRLVGRRSGRGDRAEDSLVRLLEQVEGPRGGAANGRHGSAGYTTASLMQSCRSSRVARPTDAQPARGNCAAVNQESPPPSEADRRHVVGVRGVEPPPWQRVARPDTDRTTLFAVTLSSWG